MKYISFENLKYFWGKLKAQITTINNRLDALESWQKSVLSESTKDK